MEKVPVQKSGVLLWTIAGFIEAPTDRVADLLLDVRPGQFALQDAPVVLAESGLPNLIITLTVHGGPRQFTATWDGDPQGVYVMVDNAQRSVTLQGHWWYRGVYRVEAASQGSRLLLDEYNIAPGLSRWIAPFVARGVRSQQPQTFERLLSVIGKHLGCAAYPLQA